MGCANHKSLEKKFYKGKKEVALKASTDLSVRNIFETRDRQFCTELVQNSISQEIFGAIKTIQKRAFKCRLVMHNYSLQDLTQKKYSLNIINEILKYSTRCFRILLHTSNFLPVFKPWWPSGLERYKQTFMPMLEVEGSNPAFAIFCRPIGSKNL